MMALGATASAENAPLALPSGLNARLQEVLTDRPGEGLVYRFRFVAEGFIPEAGQLETVLGDLTYLCTEYALTRISDIGPQPRQIIISLADKETEFGVADPTARQVFEAFAVEENTCIWELF
ncbi:DUF6497 family protein [Roseovarius sp. ZX-A-9]|uniref:DUF6497 family protein n=1 Tax=Roseovarius sp. ZX-A-9 TaxID=3014783 RepID=UPI00232BA230|nr:DUF6497 family protein [Roseovarius sp. ZX-A-9]